jgi:pyruvate/2-oxoglutarate dehydrogenase complex dihydrolipoamide acyltransferase (E2) component
MRGMIPRPPRHMVLPYTRGRRAALDAFVSQRQHLIHGLIEVDVTAARAILRAYQRQSGESLSFTAFVIGGVARAVDEQKTMQAYRRGRRQLIVFDDVDVAVLMEREIAGERRVVFHIVRAANTKSVLEIHQEVRAAQRARATESAEMAAVRLYDVLPRRLRRAIIRVATHVPSLWKLCAGTVAVTAVGMVGKGGGWGIPITSHPLDVTVGGISEKPGIVDGRIAVREVLNLTISVDHDVVDGAPAARFGSRLRELLESASGLEGLATPSAGEVAMATG